MAKKKKKQPAIKPEQEFIALVGLDNDSTGERYEYGVIVTLADFDEEVLLHWLKTGRIAEVTD